ncbi:MAG TPA: Mut7-C RNAse domain-containing protein [Actinomycetota bacterium]|nr:Mut7-C RNAse domain-containing protein [Actinomycetota bacterium]
MTEPRTKSGDKKASVRFYAELNDFLSGGRRFTDIEHRFYVPGSVKDVIESLGVPHTEVDLIIANGESVDFSYPVNDGDRISVYPVFESVDISPVIRLRPRPLRIARFVADANLGALARYLRLMGFDVLYDAGCRDPELVEVSLAERRCILTRDVGVLKRAAVTHGYFVRAVHPKMQAAEVVARFDLTGDVKPFTRCANCNGLLVSTGSGGTRCADCGQLYWKGSHHDRILAVVDEITTAAAT